MGSYDWALKALASADNSTIFIAFDPETTGLYPAKDRIVEIGAVKFDHRGLIGRFSVLINPGIPMNADASRINGIRDDMLLGKPSIVEVFPDFLRFIDNGTLIAHNAPFDCSFINAALKELWEGKKKAEQVDNSQISLLDALDESEDNTSDATPLWGPPFPALPNPVVDTLVLAKELLPGRPKYAMQELAKYLGIQSLDAHRAEDDARVCMELFIKLARGISTSNVH